MPIDKKGIYSTKIYFSTWSPSLSMYVIQHFSINYRDWTLYNDG